MAAEEEESIIHKRVYSIEHKRYAVQWDKRTIVRSCYNMKNGVCNGLWFIIAVRIEKWRKERRWDFTWTINVSEKSCFLCLVALCVRKNQDSGEKKCKLTMYMNTLSIHLPHVKCTLNSLTLMYSCWDRRICMYTSEVIIVVPHSKEMCERKLKGDMRIIQKQHRA